MKKFSRCALILIIVTLLGAIGGYIYESSTTTPMYTSTAKIIVTPGEKNEATVRATDGGLVKDFEIVFKSNVVISAAQKTAGTSEDIAKYLTVKTVPNSNIIELTITNPDQNTAKTYVDAIAKNAMKTTSIVAVESIQVLEYGTESNVAIKPDINKRAAIIAGIVAAICLCIELIVIFVMNAFKDDDDSDDEMDYERRFGNMIPANYMLTYDKNAYHNSGDEDDDEDEDDKFNKAIGVDIYKEELAKLGEDKDSKKKKKNKKKKINEVKEESQPEVDDIDEEVLEEPEENNVVAFNNNQESLSNSLEDYDDDEDDDDYYDEDDDIDEDDIDEDEYSAASRTIASIADSEVAAAKEPVEEKSAKSEKNAMKSSSEVLGIIRK